MFSALDLGAESVGCSNKFGQYKYDGTKSATINIIKDYVLCPYTQLQQALADPHSGTVLQSRGAGYSFRAT